VKYFVVQRFFESLVLVLSFGQRISQTLSKAPRCNLSYAYYGIFAMPITDNIRKSSHYISDCQNNCPVIVMLEEEDDISPVKVRGICSRCFGKSRRGELQFIEK